MKRCSRCRNVKPLTEFSRGSKERILASGELKRYVFPQAACKPCRCEVARERRLLAAAR